MRIATVQLDDGKIAKLEVPENATQEQINSFVQENLAQIQSIALKQATSAEQKRLDDRPTMQKVDDTLFGIGEPIVAVGSAIAAEPIAGIAGIAQTLNPLAEQGAGARAVEATRKALTVSPVSRPGQENTQALGETFEGVGNFIQGVEQGIGDAGFDATGSPTIGAIGQTLPTLAGELVGLGIFKRLAKGTQLLKNGQPTKELRLLLDKKGLDFDNLSPDAQASIPEKAGTSNAFRFPESSDQVIQRTVVSEIKAGSKAKALAKFKLDGDTVVNDLAAEEAIGQGWTDAGVQKAKVANKATRKKNLEMLKMQRQIDKGTLSSVRNRPSNIIGNSVMDRITFFDKTVDTNARKLSALVESPAFKNSPVDASIISKALTDQLDDLGVVYDQADIRKGIDFEGSDISADPTSKKAIKEIVRLLGETSDATAPRMHQLKKVLDGMIDYRKLPMREATPKAQSIVKTVRKSLNTALREANPRYGDINDELSVALDATSDFDKAIKSMRLDGESSASGIGTITRRILSNAVSRGDILDSLDKIDASAKSLGGKFDDSIEGMVEFANELEERFGSVAKTSLQNETKKAVVQAGREGGKETLIGIGLNAAGDVAEKVMGKNDANAFEAMREILERD
jgi:hypothetical protein